MLIFNRQTVQIKSNGFVLSGHCFDVIGWTTEMTSDLINNAAPASVPHNTLRKLRIPGAAGWKWKWYDVI